VGVFLKTACLKKYNKTHKNTLYFSSEKYTVKQNAKAVVLYTFI